MASKQCSFENMRAQFKEAVKVALAKGNVDNLKKTFDSLPALDVDKRSVLDQALRDHLLILLSEGPQQTSTWEHYLTLCIDACRKDLVTPTMPVVLLGDIFDASTFDKCESLFTFVENNVQLWKEDMFVGSCKNNLLRMCNDLLRRLSRSQNTVFCGRILLFLAKFFPFSERSGLNIVSEFNLENVTEFNTDEPMEMKDNETKDDKCYEEKSIDRIKVDYNLYSKFWALQDFFRNPNQCYNKVQWKVFSNHSVCVLSAFKSFKLDDDSKQLNSTSKNVDTPMDDGNTLTQHYFAKYLTNQKLLDLQLSDVNFRRYVLIQFLILFQYLNSHVKFKSETYELKPEQSEWVSETTQQVYTLLEETPPDGSKFATTVKHILQREEYWNNWKNEGCHVRRPTASSEDVDDDSNGVNNSGSSSLDAKKRAVNRLNKKPRKKLGEIMKEAHAQKKFVLGNPELTKLWNHLPDNLEACRAKDRDFLPSLDAYFEEAIEQSDPAAMVDAEYKRVNDGNFGWRALRLLARRSPHFFTHSNNPINKLPDFLETMIKKIAKDKPLSVSGGEMKSEQTESKEANEEMQAMIVNDPDAEDDDLLKAPEDRRDDARGNEESPDIKILKSLMGDLSELIPTENWKKLGVKLGYQQAEMEYFEGMAGVGRKASTGEGSNIESSNLKETVKQMLLYWCDNDDASIENLIYTLEGLNMLNAVNFLKQYQPTVID